MTPPEGGLSTNFGPAIGALGPAAIWLWVVAALGQLLIALVVAELGTRIPLAGYSYQWGARLVNGVYGWFTGFMGTRTCRSGPPRSTSSSSRPWSPLCSSRCRAPTREIRRRTC